VVLAVGAAWQLDLTDRWLADDPPSPVTEPAEVPLPAGLSLPAARPAAAVASPVAGRPVDRAAVRRAVEPLLRMRRLGRHVVVHVARASGGPVVYRRGQGVVTPASTMKLLTTVAVLQALGPEHRFATTVVQRRRSGRVVLVGGGDPLLTRSPLRDGSHPARADLDSLAAATARRLASAGRTRVRLGYDTTLFSGPAVNPRWEPSYVPDDVVSPISSLWVDEGRETSGSSDRADSPALEAAQSFARSLRRRGIEVVGAPRAGTAPSRSSGGRVVARVHGAALAQVVQHVLEVSDNEGAEVLARQVAVAEGRPASFTGAAAAVRSVLRGIGVTTTGAVIRDGSGLSRQNRLRPATLLSVLRQASSQGRPGLRSAVVDLPVAGFTGSLASRFDTGSPAGRGRVRAKTGTLTGVHGLAGTVTSADGAVMRFVAIADRVRPPDQLTARTRIDEVAAALAACTCARRATP
jgi:D-alanyl-D-alanine carboxypeptidase/D-alanyl-D-alanine-endopeptidase (penicillin-binding protein 4)